MKNYLLITFAASALLTACQTDGPKDYFDESGTRKERTDFRENDKLQKSVYYENGRESKTVYYEYKGRNLNMVRSVSADGKLNREYKISKAGSIERKVTAVDGRALQIVKYGVNNKIEKIETLRKSGQANCIMHYGISGKVRDGLSAYMYYSYDPKTDQLELRRINFADVNAGKPQVHDYLTVGIVPGAIGSSVFRWEDGFPQPVYEGPFRSELSVKLPKGIFKNGIASIYVYAGKRADRFWSEGTEQWIQLHADQAYKGYNWYLIE